MAKHNIHRKRFDFSKIPATIQIPNLIEVQKRSYDRFLQMDKLPSEREDGGLQAVFQSVFPITDFRNVSQLEFVDFAIGNWECKCGHLKGLHHLRTTCKNCGSTVITDPFHPGDVLCTKCGTYNANTPDFCNKCGDPVGLQLKYDVSECEERGMTYSAPLKVTMRLTIFEKDAETGNRSIRDIKEQEVFFGDVPLMTENGTFIVNGTERVIVSQLHRSPGVFFETANNRTYFLGKIIPYRGSWVEFEYDQKLYWTLDPASEKPTNLLGMKLAHSIKSKSGEEIAHSGRKINAVTLKEIQRAKISEIEIDVSDLEGAWVASDVVDTTTGEVLLEANSELTADKVSKILESGVVEFNLFFPERDDVGTVICQTLKRDAVKTPQEALIEIYGTIRYLLKLRKNIGTVDDIDHLGNRRVRAVGELLENQFRIGLVRMERAIKEKMSVYQEMSTAMPHDLVNAKPVMAAIREFFGSSQLSQFMDQTNPLSEITHKRRLSALGPGGLSRERAGFEVRDVHPTHQGRICPIETPEGPNIGLISSMSTFARINEFGFIETPYRKVEKGRVTDQIEYLTADREENFLVAQANAPIDGRGHFTGEKVSVRYRGDFLEVDPSKVNYMDVSPKQLVSVAAGLIPFLEHDDANRALMGSNMQRQGVPLIVNEAPLVGTGLESKVARDSHAVLIATESGKVASVTADQIVLTKDGHMPEGRKKLKTDSEAGVHVYELRKFMRSNAGTCVNQKPIVKKGQHVKRGQIIADGPNTDHGELALGRNVLVAFMPWNGYNFEDAIMISEKVVKEDIYTSIHIDEFEIGARDTKLGPEEITRDIPNVSEEALRNLGPDGVVRVGAEVKPGDILVGKITPKSETELAPEERLLRAIFGEKAADVKDTSLKVPSGTEGVVMDVKVFSRRDRLSKTDDELVEEASRIKDIQK